MSTLFFDEAGYTGSDLTNSDQPYFCVGSVCFSDEEIRQLQTDLDLDESDELHFVKLSNSQKGRELILRVLSHPLMNRDHIKFGVAEKRYCIYAQITDTLVETMLHTLGFNMYQDRLNLIFANLLYSFAVNHRNQRLIKDFEKAFVKMMRKKDDDSIDEFFSITYVLQSSPETSDNFSDFLAYILSSQMSLRWAFTDDPFQLDNTLSLFTCLINEWYKKTGVKMNVKFDSSKPLIAREGLIAKLKNLGSSTIKVGPQGREHTYPLPVGEFKLVNSTDHLGIQLADLIASAANFILKNKDPKQEPFRKELEAIPALRECDASLRPCSADYLKEVLKTHYNESPVDVITSMLEAQETDE